MSEHPTDKEIDEIEAVCARMRAHGYSMNLQDRLCAAARDRNRLEAEMGSLSIVAGIRGDLCVAERKRCEKLKAENAKLRMKARPVIYTIKEGGVWLSWNMRDRTPFHSVRFADGYEFDVINGWRKTNDHQS